MHRHFALTLLPVPIVCLYWCKNADLRRVAYIIVNAVKSNSVELEGWGMEVSFLFITHV